MSWDSEGTIILREIVGDIDAAKYSDARLKKVLAISAYRLIQEVSFTQSYTAVITSGSESVTPDPTLTDPKDYDFVNLMALRAACSILSSELSIAANEAYTIKDGPASISTGERAKWVESRYKSVKDDYDEYLKNYLLGKSKFAGVVLTPYTSVDHDYDNYCR